MKTRSGFVSNSSSSSFVVHLYDQDEWDVTKQKRIISERKERALKKFGFRKTKWRSPISIERCGIDYDENWLFKLEDKDQYDPRKGSIVGTSLKRHKALEDARYKKASLALWVPCNEDEVIEFLTEHQIPFEGVVHYGHESVFYDGNKDRKVVHIANPGLAVTTYNKKDLLGAFFPHIEITKESPNLVIQLLNKQLVACTNVLTYQDTPEDNSSHQKAEF